MWSWLHTSSRAVPAVLIFTVFASLPELALCDTPKPQKQRWLACEEASPTVSLAVAKAREKIAALWLTTPDGLFVAYRLPAERRNPFDLSKDPLMGPKSGVIQASSMRCELSQQTEARPVVLRFVSPLYRIFEAGEGWARPLRDGVIAEFDALANQTDWTLTERQERNSILQDSDEPHRPDASEIPPQPMSWAEPLPGCARGQTWNGSQCIAHAISRKQRH